MRLLILASCLFVSRAAAQDSDAQPADVAIYRDQGVWLAEADQALPALLDWLGYSYRWVNAEQIADGCLLVKKKRAFQLLIVPGGWAADYITKVGGFDGVGVGDDRLRQFLSAGGGYLGFCAGGFAAAKEAHWQGVKYDYSWKLFDGRAEGPLAWNPPDAEGLRATHGTASINLKAKQLRGSGLPERIRPLLFGGPRFVLRKANKPPREYCVLARHDEDQSAAIISFRYSKRKAGRVVLCSFHPAVLTGDGGLWDGMQDDMQVRGAATDPDGSAPDWKLAGVLVKLALGAKSLSLPKLPLAPEQR